MTSKLRRAPLFTYNDMGTRCLAASFGGPSPAATPTNGHQGHQGHPGQLQGHPGAQHAAAHPAGHHGHQGHPGYGPAPPQHGYSVHREAPPPPLPLKQKKPQPPLPLQAPLQTQPLHPHHHMECGVAGSPAPSPLLSAGAMGGAMQDSRARPERSPAKHGLHVNFTEKVEVKERREKFLTAKYGSHQMALIRKRLAVEMWLYDELQKLYESTENNKTDEVDVDIDELLDMDDDNQRRIHLQRILVDAKKSSHDVKKFVEDLLERTKTL